MEREKSTKKKNAILDVAMQLFLEKGYSATSTNEVCRRAHIKKPSLYNFFRNKRNLFFSCHMRTINSQLLPYLEKASSIGDPEDRLRFMVLEFTRIICESPELRVLIHETLSISDAYFLKIKEVWKRHFLLLKETISELRDLGKIETSLKPSRAALFILGMMTWITFWFNYGKTTETEDVVESSLEFALRGLSYKEAIRR